MKSLPLFAILCTTILFSGCKDREVDAPDSKSVIHFVTLNGDEFVQDALVTKNGNQVYVGTSEQDAFAVILSPDGSLLSHKMYGEADGREKFFCVIETADGNFVAVGSTTSRKFGAISTNSAGYAVKFSSTGYVFWEKAYLHDAGQLLTKALEKSDGSIYVTGDYSPSSANTLVMKLSADGEIIWRKAFEVGAWHDIGKSISILDENKILIGGVCSPSSFSSEVNKYVPYLIEVDERIVPRKVKERIYTEFRRSSNWDPLFLPFHLLSTPTGYIWAQEREEDGIPAYAHVVQLDAEMNVVSENKIKGQGLILISNFTSDGKDGFLLFGGSYPESNSTNIGLSKLMVLRLNGASEIGWTSYAGSDNGFQRAIVGYKTDLGWRIGGFSKDPVVGNTKILHYAINNTGDITHE
ncbi:MAG: hypothetical protein ACI8ZN_001544 [Bacteroidia bacterium]|jgi:hypothetical protein